MKKFTLTIAPGEKAPEKKYVDAYRSELENLRKKVFSTSMTSAVLAGLGLIGLQWSPSNTALAETVQGVMFAAGLVGFFFGNFYCEILSKRICDISPIPDSLLAEAAALSNASGLAREYMDGVREQKRDLFMFELDALRKLLASTPMDVARAALYG